MTVFVDTSYYIARTIACDQWHAAAAKAIRPGLRFVTSAPVINETVSLLQRRGLVSVALQFLTEVRNNPDIDVIHVDESLQREAWDLFHRLAGTGANAVDCISVAIMKRLSIKKAFTFDEHFRRAGFEILG